MMSPTRLLGLTKASDARAEVFRQAITMVL
jgi:hypothetical protein